MYSYPVNPYARNPYAVIPRVPTARRRDMARLPMDIRIVAIQMGIRTTVILRLRALVVEDLLAATPAFSILKTYKTEDLQNGRTFASLTVKNPFAEVQG